MSTQSNSQPFAVQTEIAENSAQPGFVQVEVSATVPVQQAHDYVQGVTRLTMEQCLQEEQIMAMADAEEPETEILDMEESKEEKAYSEMSADEKRAHVTAWWHSIKAVFDDASLETIKTNYYAGEDDAGLATSKAKILSAWANNGAFRVRSHSGSNHYTIVFPATPIASDWDWLPVCSCPSFQWGHLRKNNRYPGSCKHLQEIFTCAGLRYEDIPWADRLKDGPWTFPNPTL